MCRSIGIISILFLWIAAVPLANGQLRLPSEYYSDRINTEQTYFVLYDAQTAGFGYASEWTDATAYNFAAKNIILVWHFKDGTKAYSIMKHALGDLGQHTDYLVTEESENLLDRSYNPIQPLTLENFPVKLELWIGATGNQSGFKTEDLIDTVCFGESAIEYGYGYYFSPCQ
jgi:hypothetical protein